MASISPVLSIAHLSSFVYPTIDFIVALVSDGNALDTQPDAHHSSDFNFNCFRSTRFSELSFVLICFPFFFLSCTRRHRGQWGLQLMMRINVAYLSTVKSLTHFAQLVSQLTVCSRPLAGNRRRDTLVYTAWSSYACSLDTYAHTREHTLLGWGFFASRN